MGNCIICGTPVDGEICKSHEEDAVFIFTGDNASQLTSGRFYRGTVDGFADFGVFIDIGDHVTGLLHRSELDRRLESLDWESGEEVFVQVLDVRDNGNVDLGWSIRQREREFRGKLIDTPDGEYLPEDVDVADESTTVSESTTSPETIPSDESSTDRQHDDTATNGSGTQQTTASGATTSNAEPTTAASQSQTTQTLEESTTTSDEEPGHTIAEDETSTSTQSSQPSAEQVDSSTSSGLNRTTVDAIANQIGSIVRLEGEITSVRQTSGPTIFELRDETGSVECAAFEEAGVRAYPRVTEDSIVRIDGEVERHHGNLQIETEQLTILSGTDKETVTTRLEEAIREQSTPTRVELLCEDESVAAVEDDIVRAATVIRRAVAETRPIIIRHAGTTDGYVAGAAIERAVLPLVREKHTRENAEYHYVERRPLDGRIYGMDAATNDVTTMLDAKARHDEQIPLFVLVAAGSTIDSVEGYELLDIYGAETVVIDDQRADSEVTEFVDAPVFPSLAGVDVTNDNLSTTVLAANVGAHVNEDVRTDMYQLPAISFWDNVPTQYQTLASEAGFDEESITERREAVALEAYYQSYNDKRALINDLLFEEDGDLAAHVSEQFRAKLEDELDVATENLRTTTIGDSTIAILDTTAFVHRYQFPTIELLLNELHRRQEDVVATIGFADAELRVLVGPPESIDVREYAATIEETVPTAGVSVVGGQDGYIEFLKGEREAVLDAALSTLDDVIE